MAATVHSAGNKIISSKVKTQLVLQTGDITVEVEFLADGALRIGRARDFAPWTYVIVPAELLDEVLAFAAKGGDL